jgi:hypothetical protein
MKRCYTSWLVKYMLYSPYFRNELTITLYMKKLLLMLLLVIAGITGSQAKMAVANPRGLWIVEGQVKAGRTHTAKFCSRKQPLKKYAVHVKQKTKKYTKCAT